MRRSLIASTLLVAVGAFLEAAPPAGATPPVREPLELPSELVLPAGEFCSFKIVSTFPVNREIVTTFFDAEGNVERVLVSGALRVTLENEETGETVTVNIPGTSVTIDDVLTYRGRNIIFPVHGELELVSGRVVVTIDSEGFQHPVELAGSTMDLCALLG